MIREAVKKVLLAHSSQWLTPKEIAELVSTSEVYARKILKEMFREGDLDSIEGICLHPDRFGWSVKYRPSFPLLESLARQKVSA